MQFFKPALYFYNSILIVIVITNGLILGGNIAPTLLMLPLAVHYLSALIDQLTQISQFITSPTVLTARKGLTLYSFVIVLLFVVANLASSTSLAQATMTAFLMPLLFSFILEVSDRQRLAQFRFKTFMAFLKVIRKYQKRNQRQVAEAETSTSTATHKTKLKSPKADLKRLESLPLLEPVTQDDSLVTDARRRQFLKILGGGGVSLIFMMFFLPGKANAAFFGSTPGPGIIGLKDSAGNKIDPAEKKPTDGYTVSEIDDNGATSYYGFVDKTGAWYIAKEDNAGSYRYVAGASSFSTNWTNRASLTYGYFDTVF